jgi:hypothetical protein
VVWLFAGRRRWSRIVVAGALIVGCSGTPPIVPSGGLSGDDGTTANDDGGSGLSVGAATGTGGPVDGSGDNTDGPTVPTTGDDTTGPAPVSCEGPNGLCHGAQPEIEIEGGLAPLETADIDGDGNLDIVVGDWWNVDVLVLLGDGSGAFDDPIASTLDIGEVGLEDLVVLDLDDEGGPDVVVSISGADRLSLMRNVGGGALDLDDEIDLLGFGCEDLAKGDFDGDGRTDLLVAGYNAGGFLQYQGRAWGLEEVDFFGVDLPLETIFARDADGDGLPDLGVAAPDAGVIGLLTGNGGSFDEIDFWGEGDDPFLHLVEDLDGDGDGDLVVVHGEGSYVTVFLASGPWSYGEEPDDGYDLPGGLSDLTVADINADGVPDLVSSHDDFQGIAIMVGAGDGSFADPVEFSSGHDMYRVTVGDINADGINDAIAAGDEDWGAVFVVLSSAS